LKGSLDGRRNARSVQVKEQPEIEVFNNWMTTSSKIIIDKVNAELHLYKLK